MDAIKTDPAKGWEKLQKEADIKSVRQYLLETLDFNTTEWLETFTL